MTGHTPRALFLTSEPTIEHSDNHRRLPNAFTNAGWDVHVTDHDTLAFTQAGCLAGEAPLNDFDLIWPIGFGPQPTFWDRVQLLYGVDSQKFITPPAVRALYHNKALWLEFAPLSLVSSDLDRLRAFVEQHGERWVMKPTAGSSGRDVHLIDHPNQIAGIGARREGAYWLLQRFLPEIHHGEIRVLTAGAEIIGQYLRRPPEGRITANLSAGGEAHRHTLTAAQRALVDRVMDRLIARRIGFAAIDLCGDFVIEVNVADPGGLGTLETLYERSFVPALIAAVERWIQ